MKKGTLALLSLVGLLVVAGVVFRFTIGPRAERTDLQRASDAPRIKGEVTVAGDNYLGYWFLTSPEFAKRLRAKGYILKWVNDDGDYADRHKQFADGKYDIMVLPVNSYLYHGESYYYPGVIPAVLSDSKGADSIVAYQDKILGPANRPLTVNDLNNPKLKVCLTPDSPSSFLLNTAIVHFDLASLKSRGPWRVATKNGSREAYERFLKQECDTAILWEPDVSRALAVPGVTAVYGSDQISGMIIDVFVARRELMDERSKDLIASFFKTYFETLTHYSLNREQMLKEMAKNAAFNSQSEVENALKRIAWFDLPDNCRDWFGVPIPGIVETNRKERIIDTIVQVADVMIEVAELKSDPLRGNPYTITNSGLLSQLCGEMFLEAEADIGAIVPSQVAFKPFSDAEWSQLRPIGTMRTLPILFQSGTAVLTSEGGKIAGQVATALVDNFPQYRVLVKGHTAPSGNEEANLKLSQERAEAVKRYLETVHRFDPNRLKAVGVGSREPLPRQPGEGELSYRSRLARVEFILLEDKS